MANLDLDIKNLPDDTYDVYLRRRADKAELFNGQLSFVDGLATAPLNNSLNGEYVTGYIENDTVPAIRLGGVSGYSAGGAFNADGTTNFNGVAYFSDIPVWGSDSLGELFNDLEIYNDMELHA